MNLILPSLAYESTHHTPQKCIPSCFWPHSTDFISSNIALHPFNLVTEQIRLASSHEYLWSIRKSSYLWASVHQTITQFWSLTYSHYFKFIPPKPLVYKTNMVRSWEHEHSSRKKMACLPKGFDNIFSVGKFIQSNWSWLLDLILIISFLNNLDYCHLHRK